VVVERVAVAGDQKNVTKRVSAELQGVGEAPVGMQASGALSFLH
jgi:hypothetical protein